MAKLKIYTDENVDMRVAEGKLHYGVIYVEMNKFRVGECVKSLALYAEVLTAEEMRNHIEVFID